MDTNARVKQWLNAQWEQSNWSPSVIYLAFGTLTSIASEQLIQIADAVAPYPVIWSLKTNFHTCLPSSFINDQKHLLLDWAPQRLILSHPAVRFFLSHGGWNSLLECMSAGKPVLVWPLFADQMINGQRMEQELGIGQCMKNTNFVDRQPTVSSDEITGYLKKMLDRRMEYAQNARKIQEIFMHAKENDSRRCFEDIVNIIGRRVTVRMEKHIEV